MKRIHIACCILLLNIFGYNANSQNIDIDLLRSINPQNPSSKFWRGASDSYTWVSAGATLGTLAVGLINNDKELRYKAYETLIAIGINVAVTDGLKVVFNRTRPADKYPNDIYPSSVSNGHSFPSGHTSLAFATATSLTLTYKKWYVAVPAYLWAGCVGYSRMYLGKHFPSDVVAGALVGAGSSYLSHWLSKKIFKSKTSQVH
ncbi:MAG: phosphatase PAP2 family protein [Ferruginibacter sp.]